MLVTSSPPIADFNKKNQSYGGFIIKTFRIPEDDFFGDENLRKAIHKAAKRKTKRKNVQEVLNNIEEHLEELFRILYNREFVPPQHESVIINESNYQKERKIVKPEYKYEQIVHHVLIQAIRPGIEHGMYEYSMGSIPGRGLHRGAEKIKKWIREDPKNTKYAAKMDIYHFFQSVDHKVVINWIKMKYRDDFIQDLCEVIITASEEGLQLGFYTSQWFANFLLQPLDHYIKEVLHVPYDMRYMDDITLFGPNKRKLHEAVRKIDTYLRAELNLHLKDNWQVFPLAHLEETLNIKITDLSNLDPIKSSLENAKIDFSLATNKNGRTIKVRFEKKKKYREENLDYGIMLAKKYNCEYIQTTTEYGRPLDYMGFQFYREKTILRKGIMIRMCRKARKIAKGKYVSLTDTRALMSMIGWIKWCDVHEMYHERILSIVNPDDLRRIISLDQRRLNLMGMINWKHVAGSQTTRPKSVDTVSSVVSVYIRKNIRKVTLNPENGNAQGWEYDEAEMSYDDFNKIGPDIVALIVDITDAAIITEERISKLEAKIDRIATAVNIND